MHDVPYAWIPRLFYDGKIFRMWFQNYSVSSPGNEVILYATSLDGTTWTMNPKAAMTPGSPGSWDDTTVVPGHVLFNGTHYLMWYRGRNSGGTRAFGLASSTDGISWTKYAGNPVMTESPGSTSIDYPYVIKDGSAYKMWYMQAFPNQAMAIYYATSTDGIHWSKTLSPVLTPGPGWDSGGAYSPSIISFGGIYLMFYSAYSNKPETTTYPTIGYAKSNDGISWQKGMDNPLLSSGQQTDWDNADVDNQDAVVFQNTIMLYYSGAHCTIGRNCTNSMKYYQGYNIGVAQPSETWLSGLTLTVVFHTTPSTFVGTTIPGSISACSGSFIDGQSSLCGPTFSATANLPSPSTGWQFNHWTWGGGVSCSSSTANPTVCSTSGGGSLTAVYAGSAAQAFVSGTFLALLPVSAATSSGPHGDQSTMSAALIPSLESLSVPASGTEQFFAIATSQLWDSSPTVGASMAVCMDGSRLSGDMYSVGAIVTHRSLATAIALSIPSAGSHTYTLCYKTDPGGTAFVSGTVLIVVPVPASNALSSGPNGDQSSTSTTFTSSLESLTVTASGTQQYFAIATSQLWDSSPTIGASVAVCMDGSRLSGDMYSSGPVATHRHLATAISLNTPGAGSHTYTLCYKTDLDGTAFVSGTVLVVVPVSGGLSSGPDGDQSSGSATFTNSLESISVGASGSQQFLAIASSQLWDSYASSGASIAVCMDGSRLSGDMYSAGPIATHRHLAMAISLNTPAAGSHTYSLCYKTDPGNGP